MVVGFNHNFNYKGELYHIQTEDSGVKTPHIITLLYKGGTILASKKTSYADIIKVDNLEQVVEDLMKEQHREMLRRLKNGELDQLLGLTPAQPNTPPAQTNDPVPPSLPPATKDSPTASSPASPATAPPANPSNSPTSQQPAKGPALDMSLDEIILSYMVGEDRKK